MGENHRGGQKVQENYDNVPREEKGARNPRRSKNPTKNIPRIPLSAIGTSAGTKVHDFHRKIRSQGPPAIRHAR